MWRLLPSFAYRMRGFKPFGRTLCKRRLSPTNAPRAMSRSGSLRSSMPLRRSAHQYVGGVDGDHRNAQPAFGLRGKIDRGEIRSRLNNGIDAGIRERS